MALELIDEILISAPHGRVYAALKDPEILQQCIPGCEELIQHSPTDLEAKVVLTIGPVKARFGGKVTLDTADAPAGFTLRGEGVIPPFLRGYSRRTHAAIFSFWAGVMPPIPMFGRSLL